MSRRRWISKLIVECLSDWSLSVGLATGSAKVQKRTGSTRVDEEPVHVENALSDLLCKGTAAVWVSNYILLSK